MRVSRRALVALNQPTHEPEFLPTGALIRSNHHEMIAGPVVGDRQVLAHSEPAGNSVEWMESAAQRYPFTGITPPADEYHGAVAWQRMVQQLNNPWAVLDNCQHKARRAYYGVASSPTLDGVLLVGGGALLVWAIFRE